MIRVTSQAMSVGGVDGAGEKTLAYDYQIAGQRVVFQTRVEALRAYEIGPASEPPTQSLSKQQDQKLLSASNAELHYQAEVPFADELQHTICWHRNSQMQLDVAGQPVCRIDLLDDRVHLLKEGAFDQTLNLEVITGPALIMLLAQRGIYCLHAGAVRTVNGNVALVAESGVGKSTLSAHAGEHWQQFSDDILPVHSGDELKALNGFPQLKIDGLMTPYQTKLKINAQLPVDLIIRLRADERAQEISFKRMSRTDALLQVVRHTVAARLYLKPTLKEHAGFARKLSSQVPIVELTYPRNLDQLPELQQAIIDYLGAGEFR